MVRLERPTLPTHFGDCSAATGFAVETSEEKIEAIVEILTHPEKYPEQFVMQDLLIDHDENISLWRYHHVLMVERMLGMKRGTGGSEGVGYLMTTLTKRFFPEIWEARTHLQVKIG